VFFVGEAASSANIKWKAGSFPSYALFSSVAAPAAGVVGALTAGASAAGSGEGPASVFGAAFGLAAFFAAASGFLFFLIRLRTVSEGCAPLLIQCSMRSSLSLLLSPGFFGS